MGGAVSAAAVLGRALLTGGSCRCRTVGTDPLPGYGILYNKYAIFWWSYCFWTGDRSRHQAKENPGTSPGFEDLCSGRTGLSLSERQFTVNACRHVQEARCGLRLGLYLGLCLGGLCLAGIAVVLALRLLALAGIAIILALCLGRLALCSIAVVLALCLGGLCLTGVAVVLALCLLALCSVAIILSLRLLASIAVVLALYLALCLSLRLSLVRTGLVSSYLDPV